MYVIVNIAGQQFKVEKGQEIFVHRLNGNEGDKVEFNEILLQDDNGKVIIGKPHVSGVKLVATIKDHVKGDKTIVFKKKRRKGYRVRNGHRQQFTRIFIEDILIKGAKAATEEKPAIKEEVIKAESPKTAKPAEKKETKTDAKTAPPKAEKKAKPVVKKEVKPKDKKDK